MTDTMLLIAVANTPLQSNLNWIDIIFKAIPIIISLATLAYTIHKNQRTDRLNEQVEEQLDILKANERYSQVKDAKTTFEDALAELFAVTCKNTSKKDIEKVFLTTNNKFTNFYNEINEYCNMVNVGAIKAEDYIKNTISVNLSKFASIQYETFSTLQDIADKHGLKKLNKPDYKAFEDYDRFLLKYNGGEKSTFWRELKTKRKQAGFE